MEKGDGPNIKSRSEKEKKKAKEKGKEAKKDLFELSSGSVSGLNVLYQQQNPLMRLHKRVFELSPVMSRVSTTPSTIYSPSDDEIQEDKDGKVLGNETHLLEEGKPDGAPMNPPDEPLNNSFLESEEIIIVDSAEEEEAEDATEAAKQTDSVGEKWKSVQDNLALHKSSSPICFFKNPGFGNRYAFKIKNDSPSPLIQRSSQLALLPEAVELEETPSCAAKTTALTRESEMTEQTLFSSTERRDSTQFILSPLLSESNMSVMDKEIPMKTLQRSKKLPPLDDSEKDEHVDPLEEMTAYNEQWKDTDDNGKIREGDTLPLISLGADPEVCNLCPQPRPRRTAKPVMLPPELSKTPSQIKVEAMERAMMGEDFKPYSDESGQRLLDDSPMDSSKLEDIEFAPLSPEEGVSEEPLVVPSQRSDCKIRSSTSSLPKCPSVVQEDGSSWTTVPSQVCTISMQTMPWRLVSFCIFVVITAGMLGFFLSIIVKRISPSSSRHKWMKKKKKVLSNKITK